MFAVSSVASVNVGGICGQMSMTYPVYFLRAVESCRTMHEIHDNMRMDLYYQTRASKSKQVNSVKRTAIC